MNAPVANEVTRLHLAWSDCDESTLERVTPPVYVELHRVATGYLHQEQPGHILQADCDIQALLTGFRNSAATMN